MVTETGYNTWQAGFLGSFIYFCYGFFPDLLEGFSLHPEAWIKNQTSLYLRPDKSPSVTPVVSPPSTQEKAVSELAAAGQQVSAASADADVDVSSDETETKTETNNSDDSSDGQDLTVCVGETERLVAHCKLQVQFDQLFDF